MIGTANDDSRRRLLLEVAFEAKIGVAGDEHLVVDSAVRVVTGGASFAHGLMLEDKRSALGGVALATGIVLGKQGRPAAADC